MTPANDTAPPTPATAAELAIQIRALLPTPEHTKCYQEVLTNLQRYINGARTERALHWIGPLATAAHTILAVFSHVEAIAKIVGAVGAVLEGGAPPPPGDAP